MTSGVKRRPAGEPGKVASGVKGRFVGELGKVAKQSRDTTKRKTIKGYDKKHPRSTTKHKKKLRI